MSLEKSFSDKNPSNILWLKNKGSESLLSDEFKRNNNIEVCHVSSYIRAKEELEKNKISVVIIETLFENETEEENYFFSVFRNKFSYISRIAIVENYLEEYSSERTRVRKVINLVGLTKIVCREKKLKGKEEESKSDLEDCITESIKVSNKQFGRVGLYKKSSQQNKKLQELTTNLGDVVSERTKHIVSSKEEVQKKIQNIKKLVLFIKHLSSLKDLDELLPLLKNEFKKNHQLRPPVFCCPSVMGKGKAYYFNKGIVLEKKIEFEKKQLNSVGVNERDDSLYLANLFSRPFTKIISIPLNILNNTNEGSSFEKNLGVLYFEHNLEGTELNEFVDSIKQRMQPICVAVDRVLLELQAKYVSSQWEGTFEGFASPISIINKKFLVERSNSFFSLKKSNTKCFTQFSGNKKKCLGCPAGKAFEKNESVTGRIHVKGKIYDVHSYPIMAYGRKTPSHVINQYIDITESRSLYGKVVQNEKLIAMGSLAGHVTHELNNPLTGLRSLSQILVEELKEKNKNVQKNIDNNLLNDLVEIEKAAMRSQGIIKNLMEFSDTKNNNDLQIVDLNEVIEKTLPLLKTAFRDFNNIVELTEKNTKVRLNSSMIQQVIFNLINNACQAMSGSGTLSVFTENQNDEIILIKIKDTGPGIPRAIKEHIFEPFFTTKSEGHGTGLGLSMCRSIVENYGGTITVLSEEGHGAEFVITLSLVL